MVGRPAEANTGIDPIEALLGNGAPPLVEVVNVEPNHEVLREVLVIEALENELGATVPEPRVAIVLPYLVETQISEKSATGLVILAARHERKQRISVEILHGSPCITVSIVRMPN